MKFTFNDHTFTGFIAFLFFLVFGLPVLAVCGLALVVMGALMAAPAGLLALLIWGLL